MFQAVRLLAAAAATAEELRAVRAQVEQLCKDAHGHAQQLEEAIQTSKQHERKSEALQEECKALQEENDSVFPLPQTMSTARFVGSKYSSMTFTQP